MEDQRIYVDVDLFRGDYCPRLSPDLLQVKESQTQTDDETASESSVDSAATTLLKSNVSEKSFTDDELLTEDERSPVIPPTPVKSSEKTKIVNCVTSVTPVIISDSPENLLRDLTPSLSPVLSINSKDSSHSIEISSTKRKPRKFKTNQPDELTLSSSNYTSSNDSTHSKETYSSKIKSKKSEIIKINDSDEESSTEKSEIIKRITSKRPKKEKISRKRPANCKKRIVMNKVVYPSSFPTSSEDSSDSEISTVSQRTRLSSLSSKIVADKHNIPSNSKKK